MIEHLKDSLERWDPSAFLACLTYADKMVANRRKALQKQLDALSEHETALSTYIRLHEHNFKNKYEKWYSKRLIQED